jgi:hypothetical protein
MNSVECATYRGGLYDRSTSATENDVANMVAHTFDDTIANWTRDDIKLQGNTSLSQTASTHMYTKASSALQNFQPS